MAFRLDGEQGVSHVASPDNRELKGLSSRYRDLGSAVRVGVTSAAAFLYLNPLGKSSDSSPFDGSE